MSDVRHELALKVFSEYPEMSREDRRPSILNGQIEIGMTPYEAKLAGGEFSYKVMADTTVWVPNTDPLRVMWNQSVAPDGSRIWMTFQNTTQFGTVVERVFTVYFIHGKACNINQVET